MFNPGDVISYLDMCQVEGVNLQRGMNYRLRGGTSVILMSLRPNAPYADLIKDNGQTLIYEGHDVPKTPESPPPKTLDQRMKTPAGALTQNGLFYRAAKAHKCQATPESVRVYEKLRAGIWVYNGVFKLLDAWMEQSGGRCVFKFKLELTKNLELSATGDNQESFLEHNRLIPPQVKLEVWKRDQGRCRICG